MDFCVIVMFLLTLKNFYSTKNHKVMKRVVVLTGAGISAESGISTFRDSGGLWEQYRIEDVASPEGWIRDPDWLQTSTISGESSCSRSVRTTGTRDWWS